MKKSRKPIKGIFFEPNNKIKHCEVYKQTKNNPFYIFSKTKFNDKNFHVIFLQYLNKKATLYSPNSSKIFKEWDGNGHYANSEQYGVYCPEFVFFGKSFLDENEMIFDYIDIYYDKLNNWIGQYSIDEKYVKKQKLNYGKIKKEFLCKNNIKKDIHYFEIDNVGFEFLYEFKKLQKNIAYKDDVFYKKGCLISRRFIRIYPKGLSFEKCWENIVIPIKYLITIFYNNLEGLASIYEIKAIKKNKKYNIIFSSQKFQYNLPRIMIPSSLDFKIFKKYYEEIMANWFFNFFKIKELIILLTHVYNTPEYDDCSEMYDPGLFLSYAQILESMHRFCYNQNPLNKQEWSIIKEELINNIDRSSLIRDKKDTLIKKIENLNQASLMERLTDIKSKFNKTISIFMNDQEYALFATYFVKSRNYYTHYSHDKKCITDEWNLFEVSRKTELLIYILIFEILLPERTHLINYGLQGKNDFKYNEYK